MVHECTTCVYFVMIGSAASTCMQLEEIVAQLTYKQCALASLHGRMRVKCSI